MRSRPFLVALLLAALASLDLAAVLRDVALPRCPSGILPAALALSQVGLLAVWLALGGEGAPGRAAVLFAVAGAWVLTLGGSALGSGDGLGTMMVLFATLTAMVVVGLGILRSVGIGLLDATRPARPQPGPHENGHFRFPLGELIAWTVALAMFLSLAQLVKRAGVVWPSREALTGLAPFALGLAITAVGAVWAAFAARATAWGWVPVVAGVAIAARTFPGTDGGLALAILFATLILGPLAVFRVCAYRLARSDPIHRVPHNSVAGSESIHRVQENGAGPRECGHYKPLSNGPG